MHSESGSISQFLPKTYLAPSRVKWKKSRAYWMNSLPAVEVVLRFPEFKEAFSLQEVSKTWGLTQETFSSRSNEMRSLGYV